MKNFLFAFLLLTGLSCFATGPDSTFHRHEFSVSAALGASQLFFDKPTHGPTNRLSMLGYYGTNPYALYLPEPATHIQLQYSFGISPMIRLETGIGYLLQGYRVELKDAPPASPVTTVGIYNDYLGLITLPLHLKIVKPMPHGAFVCIIGPDFCLPVHLFYRETFDYTGTNINPETKGHSRLSTSETAGRSTMGAYLKLGYEKRIKSNLSINVGPVVDFFQLVEFHPEQEGYRSTGYYPYQFYAGLDVSVNFGFKIGRK